MPPTPQEYTDGGPQAKLDGDSVVISGMSGLYPQCQHIKDLSNILYNKINPVTKSNRWKYNHPEVTQYVGMIPGLDKFDAQFFKVHFRMSESMDSMGKKILEQAYQAIYDAGISPEQLNGKKVGVYAGSCFSETEKACFYVASTRTGFGIAGCSKTMCANRISYWLNAKGPSMSLDEACCSSLVALELAYQDIARGECEAAIVGGASLTLHPHSSIHYGRIMNISKDGKTKSFDQNASGCSKSEAINVLFLQKAKYAKRVYAEVLHVKTSFIEILPGETGPRYGFYRSPQGTADFLKQFYEEAGVSPKAIEYVEAFGSAVPEADKSELEALDRVFCQGREQPLLVGSVMSNIGYSEAASGIAAVTKVLLGYHKGQLAGNINCENPRNDVAALRDGRMQILTDHEHFRRTYTAVNGLSVTGVNAHVLLNGRYKPKDPNRYVSKIPHLVTVSARQDVSVKKILDDLKSRPIDPEELALFHNIHSTSISGHLGRGYTILDVDKNGETVSLSETSSYLDNAKRPLWFVYSGMGSQWPAMGAQLMRVPVFAAAIERCRKALEPKGVDLVHIITSPDKEIFNNILNSFVGIAAIQIGLTDILTSIGIKPDMIIGHSVGELGCAYADGCFTPEEVILAAYSRGLVSVQTKLIRGSMAAVGIGYEQISKILPPEIDVACHNAAESSTISGPADRMREFVTDLTSRGIFAKEVPCSNIAYHSRYIAEAGPGLLKYLKEVIKSPKRRSSRWVSTSVPQERWGEPAALTSSAEYHTNNLLSPVLFEETSRLIPRDAVLVEIAPHGLLQAILKRSLPESCKNIALTRRGHPDNALMMLDAVGKLYMEGYNPNVEALYPKIDFPVSTGTPMLSHLVEWAHNESWSLPLFLAARHKTAAAATYVLSIHDLEHQYLQGHRIKGQNLYPFSASLVAVWDTLAMSLKKTRKYLSVEFSEVCLYAQPVLHDRRNLRISVALHKGTGRFEVMEEDRKVATGRIIDTKPDKTAFADAVESRESLTVDCEDVYQMFYDRDYFYQGEFRSIKKTNPSLTEAEIIWKNNWVTFLDAILQLSTLRCPHTYVSLPQEIRKISIDTKMQMNTVSVNNIVKADVLKNGLMIRCGGIIISDVKHKNLSPSQEDEFSLNALKFVPRFQSNAKALTAIQTFMQIVSENVNKTTLNILAIVQNIESLTFYEELTKILDTAHGIKINYEQVERENVVSMRDQCITEVDLVIVQDLLTDDTLCQILYRILPRDMFILNAEQLSNDVRPNNLYKVVSSVSAEFVKLELIRWRPPQANNDSTIVTVRNNSDISMLKTTQADLPSRHRLVVLSSYPTIPGLKDLVKQWRQESTRNQIYLISISENDCLDELPELNLAFNVLDGGVWGGEYYVTLQENKKADQSITLRSTRIGDLDSLYWAEVSNIGDSGLAVNVEYAAVSNWDFKTAMGVKKSGTDDMSFGMDFSGTTDGGVRVMGVTQTGALSSRVVSSPDFLLPVPSHWSMEDAATVPSAYLLAFYCLTMKLEFNHGMRLLVHGGAGALGQAVISIALAHGCEVFTTVSDVRKKRFLVNLFPDLKEDHIGNSRDWTFGDLVRNKTKNKGCDIAISCVSGDLKDMTLRCCGRSAVMLDLAQLSTDEKYSFGMSYLTGERNYVTVDLSHVFRKENAKDLKKLLCLMCEGIRAGYVRPLSRVTFDPRDTARAFRLLAGSKHRGRVLIRLTDTNYAAYPRLFCSPVNSHVILCNGDPFALQFAERLISRGSRRLVIHSESKIPGLNIKVKSWEKLGVQIGTSSVDLNSIEAVQTLLSKTSTVEGIFMFTTNVTDRTFNKMNTVISFLDDASRLLCPSLKHFAVINARLSLGQKICSTRTSNSLPGKVVNVPILNLENGKSTEEVRLRWRSVVDILERSLRTVEPVVEVRFHRKDEESLLQQIASLADLTIPDDVDAQTSLTDLGFELEKVPAVVHYLTDVHNIAYSEDVIPHLTIQQLRDLDEVTRAPQFPELRGLEKFINYIDPDELQATLDIAFLPTSNNKASTRDDELDVTETYLCIIPGLEGHHARFRLLCERLKVSALVLQPGLDHLDTTLRTTAERYAEILINKLKFQKTFYLLGYESGVMVALEIASILEKKGLTGIVYCLGGAPEEFQAYLEKELSQYESVSDLQEAILRHMFSLMAGNTNGVDQALQSATSWSGKVEACVRLLLGQVAHSAQYTRSLLEAAYKFIKQARGYTVNQKPLRSRIIVIHPSLMTIDKPIETLMQRFSEQPVLVYEVPTSLEHVLQDLRCTAIVNTHLHTDLLNNFENMDLCDRYLLNADIFMSSITIEETVKGIE